MKTNHDLSVSAVVAGTSLLAALICHHFLPGFGMMLKPLLWPLLVLPFSVRLRYALPTAFVVPWLSALMTGMPSPAVATALSLGSVAGVVLIHWGAAALRSVIAVRLGKV